MSLFDKTLEKLTIIAYANQKLPHTAVGSVTATYNPESINFSYNAEYESVLPLDQSKSIPVFRHLNNGELNLSLQFDSMSAGKKVSVSQQIIALNKLCTSVSGPTAETNYLEVKWGKLSWNEMEMFLWRMQTMTSNYTLFDRDGTPMRANVDLVLVPCPRLSKDGAGSGAKSSFSKLVKDKDTLPTLAAVEGEQADYLSLAQDNPQLNSLNDVSPGTALKSFRGRF